MYMSRAITLQERVMAYRKALQVNPHIAYLQILDINRPIALTDIFIRLRLHSETKPSYELDPVLRDAELQRDPDALLKASQLRLEEVVPGQRLRQKMHCGPTSIV